MICNKAQFRLGQLKIRTDFILFLLAVPGCACTYASLIHMEIPFICEFSCTHAKFFTICDSAPFERCRLDIRQRRINAPAVGSSTGVKIFASCNFFPEAVVGAVAPHLHLIASMERKPQLALQGNKARLPDIRIVAV